MRKNKRSDVIEKGFYNHTQASGNMNLKQYIITRRDNKKCLLLRFFNESQLCVTGMEFVLTQMDADGKVIDNSVVNLEKIKVRTGEVFIMNNGIVISDKCVDFTVQVKSLISAGYRYSVSNGKLIPEYDVRMNRRKKPKNYGKMQVTRKNLSSARLSAAVALVIIILMAVLGVDAALRPFGIF